MGIRYLLTAVLAVTAVLGMDAAGRNPVDSLLNAVYERDQAVRQGFNEVLSSGDVDAILEFNRRMAVADSENQALVFGMLDSGGWPEGVSERAVTAIFLVIDHAGPEYQKKYFEMMRVQAGNGVLKMSDFVTLQDRILMHEGKPQIHGTQTMSFYREGANVTYLWPVEDPDNLDARRAGVGLIPIAQYLDVFKDLGMEVIWDKTITPACLYEMREK